MQIKNKKKIFIIFLISFFLFNSNLKSEEFNVVAEEVILNKDTKTLIGTGNVQATDLKGTIINADKITYEKEKEFLLAEGNVIITDKEGNILKANKATYDKINEIINTYENSEMYVKGGYKLLSQNILYNINTRLLSSDNKSTFSDIDGNIIETSMFQYNITNNLFSSVGKIKITDNKKNEYLFKEVYVDTNKKEMVGSDVSVVLDQANFGSNEKSDPRFVANDVLMSKNKTILSKGVFTVCQKKDNKCPPWSIKAKKITYDKIKKNIYYDHAILKVYDVPIFYFPKFFHPDPSVERQSGFLFPNFTSSTHLGGGATLPYYWAITKDRDITFTPKYYKNDNALFLNEYRQAFENGFLTLDTGYTQGYKNTSKIKTKGSRNHVFADLDLVFNKNQSYENNLSINVERASNDKYFKNHSINTSLVNSEITTLKNEINYNFAKNNMYLNITGNMYENLGAKNNSRYEYILPNVILGKTFFSEKYGSFDLKTNTIYNNYESNKKKATLTNDLNWKPFDRITKNGFINSVEGMLRNTNYQARKTNEFKDEGNVNELNGVITYKSSLPMKKDMLNNSNLISPNFMLRIAPVHMRNLNKKDEALRFTNLYSLNRTSEIERGLSAVLGFDYKIDQKGEKNKEKEKFSLSLGQVFSHKKLKDLPTKSSLDQKMSDVVGEINYNFSEIGNIDYKFSLDHNYNNLNYNNISTNLNFGMVTYNLDYLEENSHVGSEHYASTGVTLNFNDNNKLSLSTKKNFKTDSTELYNVGYQYEIDCLTAGLVYRREFYQDSDLEANNTLMFTITFKPFGAINSPSIKQ